MSRYFWLLDNGHGGVINGVPQTAGKRSPKWSKGVLYEGESNRLIVNKLKKRLDDACISCKIIVPEIKDISLGDRARRINAIARKFRNAIGLSFHSDAFKSQNASGWSAFTYYGETDSDKVASIFYKHAEAAGLKIREDYSDGDADKEANFFILRETACPMVLIENLFMTNKKDYAFLKSKKGQETLVNIAFDAIQEIEKNGI